MSQPPQGYRVELEAYAGPMDLLLYLVRRHEIDLNDIPIAKLTEQYLEHLKVIETIDVEKAGEFLVMAATLLEIKSLMIAPSAELSDAQATDAADLDEPGEAAPEDPRMELVRQLLAYKRYKDAAIDLEQRFDQWHQRYAIAPAARTQPDRQDDAERADLELEDAHVMDLCTVFARIMDQIGQRKEHEVTYDETPISLHAADIRDRLAREGGMSLNKMFEGRPSRAEMIGLFLALLELVRDREVTVKQDEGGDGVSLELRDTEDAKNEVSDEDPRSWRDPETGEVQYDWPDEESRKRAERRQRLREKRARGEVVEPEEADDQDEAFEIEENEPLPDVEIRDEDET